MKYLDFLWALDILYRCYPRYHSNDMLILADDVWKWLNNELPADSSTLKYLQSCFDSPTEALRAIWKEMQLIIGPFSSLN